MNPLTFERLHERGAALGTWIDARGSISRLVALDRDVRRGRCTDWPGRPPGPERRQDVPDGGAPAAATRP